MSYKYKLLPELLDSFSQMIWDIAKHEFYKKDNINRKERDAHKIFFGRCIHPYITQELQACFSEIISKRRMIWNNALKLVRSIHHIIDYVNSKPDITSILDIPRTIIEEEYPGFLAQRGIKSFSQAIYISTQGYEMPYIIKRHELAYILRMYNFIYEYNYIKGVSLMNKDIWYLSELGFEVEGLLEYKMLNMLSFRKIKQPIIKQVMKKYILGRLMNKLSISTIQNDMAAFVIFSRFLAECHPDVESLAFLTRDHIESFYRYLKETDMKPKSKKEYKATLRLFLHDITIEEWLDAPTVLLILKREMSFRPVIKPRIFSENEILLLKQDAHLLEDTPRRMLIMLIGIGMRSGELCLLKVEDIKKGEDGRYYLQYFQHKTKKFNICDLRSAEMAEVRQVLEEAISDNNGSTYVFPHESSVDKPFSLTTFVRAVKKLIIKEDIRINGELIVFQTHKCRRRKATIGIKGGKTYRFVSTSLGHKHVHTLRYYVAPPTTPEMKDELKRLHEIDNRIIENIMKAI